MAVTAKLRYLRIAPRKVRLIADLIRGKKVEEAQKILNFTVKKTAQPLLKLLDSAVANARNNFQIESANLYISKITVDEGPKYKRWRARARGQAYQIQKKSSHITLILDEISPAKKGKKIEKPAPLLKKTEVKEKPASAGLPVSRQEAPAGKEEDPKEVLVRERHKPEMKEAKPKTERGLKRFFRRKAF